MSPDQILLAAVALGAMVAGEVWRQHLDRHLARQPHFGREVHDPHPAATELANERVLAGEGRLHGEEQRIDGGLGHP